MSHGGKRKNAGRKPVKNKAQSRVIRVPESIAPTIKRVIDALKNDPSLENSILDFIYSQGHVTQLQQMKANIQAYKQPAEELKQERFEKNGFYYVNNVGVKEIDQTDCDDCQHHHICFSDNTAFPGTECNQSSDYFIPKE